MREEIAEYERKYLIDSDVIINHMKGKNVDLLFNLSKKGTLCISVLTEFEILSGIYKEEDIEEMENCLSTFKKIDVLSEICRKAAEFRKKNKQINQALSEVDLLISSTCYIYKMILVTNNIKHFKLIPEIKIYEE